MLPADEHRLMNRVIDRLVHKFPTVSQAQITETVTREHHSHDNDPVRTYLPVLVERAVTQQLHHHHTEFNTSHI